MGSNGLGMASGAWGPPAAPPMVLLHALGESAADWEDVAPVFAEYWQVYAPDLRGHGRSDWPGDYSMELMCADVAGGGGGAGAGPGEVTRRCQCPGGRLLP